MMKTQFCRSRIAVALLLIIASCGPSQDVVTPSHDEKSAVQFTFHETSDNPVTGWTRMDLSEGDQVGIWVAPTPSLTIQDIARARRAKDENARPALAIQFTATGAEKARKFSAAQTGKKIAILLDGRLIIAPMITEQFSENSMINSVAPEQIERILGGIRPK